MSDMAGRDGANLALQDEIKAYWSDRAKDFDASPGHAVASDEERSAWYDIIERHLGAGQGRKALDLACGTGEITALMDDLGFAVTSLDWSETMLAIAADKVARQRRSVSFRMADAAVTMEPDGSYDALIARHLVWTLVDPPAAFAEWIRVLGPGGRLLIIDGDFVTRSVVSRVLGQVAKLMRHGSASQDATPMSQDMLRTHQSILSRVYFREGARSGMVAEMLEKAGFEDIRIDPDFRAVHRAQGRVFGRLMALERNWQHRYAISARKP